MLVGFAYELVKASDGVGEGELRRFSDQRHQEPVFLVQVHGEKLLNGPTGYGSLHPFRVSEPVNEPHDRLMLSQHSRHQKTALFSLSGSRVQGSLLCEGVGNKLMVAPRGQRVPGRALLPGVIFHGLDQ